MSEEVKDTSKLRAKMYYKKVEGEPWNSNMKLLRTRRGVSLDELAYEVNINLRKLSLLERGIHKNVKPEDLEKIAAYLNVDYDKHGGPDKHIDQVIEDLVSIPEEFGLSESLDEIVHEIFSNMASEVNNVGVRKQLHEVKRNLGEDYIRELSDSILKKMHEAHASLI